MNDRRTRLWAGWRQQYLDSTSSRRDGEPSIFSRILESGLSDDDTLIVRRGERCFALMNLHPYSAGHLMVLPKREVADLSGLLAAESAELWSMVAQAVGLMKSALGAQGVNVGINLGSAAGGSVPEHLHIHVVPRWSGDVNFMGSTAETRVIPEAIDVTAARIRAAWSNEFGEV